MDPFCHLCFVFLFVILLCSLVVTCWEGAKLLALLCVMFSGDFVTFQYRVLGQVWYLIYRFLIFAFFLSFIIK